MHFDNYHSSRPLSNGKPTDTLEESSKTREKVDQRSVESGEQEDPSKIFERTQLEVVPLWIMKLCRSGKLSWEHGDFLALLWRLSQDPKAPFCYARDLSLASMVHGDEELIRFASSDDDGMASSAKATLRRWVQRRIESLKKKGFISVDEGPTPRGIRRRIHLEGSPGYVSSDVGGYVSSDVGGTTPVVVQNKNINQEDLTIVKKEDRAREPDSVEPSSDRSRTNSGREPDEPPQPLIDNLTWDQLKGYISGYSNNQIPAGTDGEFSEFRQFCEMILSTCQTKHVGRHLPWFIQEFLKTKAAARSYEGQTKAQQRAEDRHRQQMQRFESSGKTARGESSDICPIFDLPWSALSPQQAKHARKVIARQQAQQGAA